MLEKPIFTPTKDQEERDKEKSKVYTIRLNDKEIKRLEEASLTLQQEKLTTVIKQLVNLGLSVLQDKRSLNLLNVILQNKERNERIGIKEIEPRFKKL